MGPLGRQRHDRIIRTYERSRALRFARESINSDMASGGFMKVFLTAFRYRSIGQEGSYYDTTSDAAIKEIFTFLVYCLCF